MSKDATFAQRIGTLVRGKWTIESLLGVGGMAAVYGATHRNGQRAALKILHLDFARDTQICERFLREAYVSNKIGHPATVQVLDDDTTEEGEPYLVMELLLGETVRDAWRRVGRTMPLIPALQIADRVLDCLSACHNLGVIHRDLKPANIFITDNSEVKVLDFGVAQMRDANAERTAVGTAMGTPAYMSPEQAKGKVDDLDGRADLFSVGAVIHALVTGHRINSGRTEQEALFIAGSRPVPSVARIAPNLPVELIRLVDRALAWDPRNRFADAAEMQDAVLEALAAQGGEPLAERGGRPRNVLFDLSGAPTVEPTAPKVARAAMPAAIDLPGEPVRSRVMASEPPTRLPTTVEAPAAIIVDEPKVPDNDPGVVAAKEWFRHWDRILPSVRQLGWEHPATVRALRTMFEAFGESFSKQARALVFELRPYSFVVQGHSVWEPVAPFDSVPYHLFASGMRRLTFSADLQFEELREVFTLFSKDPGADLPPEDDLGTALWERDLAHVQAESCDMFAEGDATEREAFVQETAEIEDVAGAAVSDQVSALEARAMALSTDAMNLSRVQEASPFSLESAQKTLFRKALTLGTEEWTLRFIEALVAGYVDAARAKDAPLVLASLRKSAADLLVSGKLSTVAGIHVAVSASLAQHLPSAEDVAKLSRALGNALFGADNVELLLIHLEKVPSEGRLVAHLVPSLSEADFERVVTRLAGSQSAEVFEVFLPYVRAHLERREEVLAGAIQTARGEAARALVGVLVSAGTAATKSALGVLANSQNAEVRVECIVQSADNPEAAVAALAKLLDEGVAEFRLPVLEALLRHQLRTAVPHLARIVRSPAFTEYALDERQSSLRALLSLSPDRGEPVVLELAKKSGLVSTEDRERTRIAACRALGDVSRSAEASLALSEIVESRWGTSAEIREAAHAALQQVRARIDAEGETSA